MNRPYGLIALAAIAAAVAGWVWVDSARPKKEVPDKAVYISYTNIGTVDFCSRDGMWWFPARKNGMCYDSDEKANGVISTDDMYAELKRRAANPVDAHRR